MPVMDASAQSFGAVVPIRRGTGLEPELGSGVVIDARAVLTCRHVVDRFRAADGAWQADGLAADLCVAGVPCADVLRTGPPCPSSRDAHDDLAILLLASALPIVPVAIAVGPVHEDTLRSARLHGFERSASPPGYRYQSMPLEPQLRGLVDAPRFGFVASTVAQGMSGGPLLSSQGGEEVCLGVVRLGSLGKPTVVVTGGSTIAAFLQSPAATDVLRARGIEVRFRHLLRDELAAYLEDVRREARELPRFFPAHMRAASAAAQGLPGIRQRVALLDPRDRERLKRLEKEEAERHTIAGASSMFPTTIYDPLRRRPHWSDQNRDETKTPGPAVVDWDDRWDDPTYRQVLILGDPGVGKSWLLRAEAHALATNALGRIAADGAMPRDLRVPLPFQLPDLARRPHAAFSDRIEDQLKLRHPSALLRGYLLDRLAVGAATLLLDAWDETPDSNAAELQQSLRGFAVTTPCRVHLTSRGASLDRSPLPDGTPELQIVPFERRQVEAFVHEWFRDDAAANAAFLSALHHHRPLGGLARIPLLLAFLCRIFKEPPRRLPVRRVDAYRKCLYGLVVEWKECDDKPGAAPARMAAMAEAQIEEIGRAAAALFPSERFTHLGFARAAGYPVRKRDQIASAAAFVDAVIDDGVLVREADALRFLHRTFHEYLTASSLSRRRKPADVMRLVVGHALEGEWQEVVTLLAGELTDPSPLLGDLSDVARDDLFRPRRALAARCLPELSESAWEIASVCQLADRITGESMNDWWALAGQSIEGAAPELVASLAALAMANRLTDGVPLLSMIAGALKEPDSKRVAVALKFVRQAGPAAATPEIADALVSLMSRGSLIREAGWALRAIEADEATTAQAVNTLLPSIGPSHPSENERIAALDTLAFLGPGAATPTAISALLEWVCIDPPASASSSAAMAAEALAALGHRDAFDAIVSLFFRRLGMQTNHDHAVVRAIVRLAPPAGRERVLSELAARIRGADSIQEENAVRALEAMGPWAATSAIRDTLVVVITNQTSGAGYWPLLLWPAVRALGALGPTAATPEVVILLRSLLSHRDLYVRGHAAQAIADIGPLAGTADIVQELVDELQAKHPQSSQQTARALASLQPVSDEQIVFGALIAHVQSLAMQSPFLRAEALPALGACRPSPKWASMIAEVLVGLLRDVEPVRDRAAEALGALGYDDDTGFVRRALLANLRDEFEPGRHSAGNALGLLQRRGMRLDNRFRSMTS